MVLNYRVIFLVLAILAIGNVTCDEVDENSYENKVDDLLRKLKAAIDKAVLQAQNLLDKARAELALVATKYEGEADTTMAVNEKTLLDQLTALETQAKNKNISVTECLGDNETKLNILPTTYHANMLSCVNGAISDGTKYAQGALDKIKSLVNEIENIKQEIKDCGHGFKAVKCLAKLAIKIEKDITSLPDQIEVAGVQTALAIAKLQPRVKNCASDSASKCGIDGQNLFNIISNCIKSKINS